MVSSPPSRSTSLVDDLVRSPTHTSTVSRVALAIRIDDPHSPDVERLIETHLAFARGQTPLCHVFALAADALVGDDVELYSCRDDGLLLGIGALRSLGDGHFEVKSMHTALDARGRGIGKLLLQHLIATARRRGAKRVSLETGTSAGFAPARALYEGAGFEECAPFADYPYSDDNVCMTMFL